MASIRHSIETNKKLLILIALLLALIAVLVGRFYFQEKRENRALRLKILSMSENRRTPKPLATLMTPSTKSALTIAPAATTPISEAIPESNNTVSIRDQDTQELAVQLNSQMRRPRNLNLETLDNNIAIADELVSREPDSYSAYKAKLVSLLVKEGKFNQAADEEEIEGILENMAQFNIGSDKLARREASLIANSNAELDNVDRELNSLALERENLESQLSNLDANSPELQNINDRLAQLENLETNLLSNADAIEAGLANNSARIVNEDIIEIPFMRMLAKNDYDGVMNNAQTFIEEFPNSPSGYYYMIKALEMQGQKDQALGVIQNSRLSPDVQNALLQRLESEAGQDPKNYWQKLSF